MDRADYTADILDYLKFRRGQLVAMMTMVGDLTRQISRRGESRRVRGLILADLSRLVRERKVIRYRKVTMVSRRPRSSQGLLRISESCA